MDADEFYARLRPEDRESVSRIVYDLKGLGFMVCAAGSSLERNDYNDVDLVVYDQSQGTGLTFGKLSLYLMGLNAEDITQSTLNITAHEPSGYVGSNIKQRFRVRRADTLVDISMTDVKPFDVSPETKSVLL